MDEKENTRELVVVDVKRYKKVKHALQESEERYRQLFENVPIGIYRTTPDGRIVDANPALVKMLGYESFADLSTRDIEKDYSDAGNSRADFIKRLKRDDEIVGLEAVWSKKDGSPIHVRENAKLTRTEDGQVLFEGTVEDITLSKQAEAAQKIRNQQLEILNRIICSGNLAESMVEMLENILDCVIALLAFDMAGIYMYDPEARKVNLLARRGAPSQFYLMEKYMAIDKMPFSQVLLHGQSVFVDHLRKTLPDLAKKWKWQMACSIPLVSKGRVVGAINVASSQRSAFTAEEKGILELIGKEAGTLISKLQTETALRESEKYYRTLIDISPDIIVVMDLEAKLLTVNQQFLKSGGYFYDEVIGVSAYDFISGLEYVFLKKKNSAFIKKKKVSGSEYLFKKKDGRTILLEVSASLLNDGQGRPQGIIAIGRDISERKRAELDIKEKNKVLASLNEISLELALMPPAVDINEYISKKLMGITNAIYVGVNHYNKDTRQLEFICANTASKVLNKVNNILGKKIGNFKYDVSEAMYKEITAEVVGYRKTLHEASFGAIPEKASSIIQRSFKIDNFIGMALVVEGELIGTAIMVISKGTPAVSEELLKSFSHIVSVSLRRRQAEYQLVASEEKFKKLFYISPDSIILSRLHDTKIVSVNKGFTKIMGYEESEVVGKTTIEINIYKNPEEHYKIIDALRTKGMAENIEYWFVSKSGINILGLVSAAIIDINGEKYIMSTIRDVTEHKRAEEALRVAETRYRLLFEQSPDGIVIIDPATAQLLEFNETAHRQLGYSRQEFARLSISDFEAAETPEETRSHIARVMDEGLNDFETRHRTRQGEIRNIQVTAQFTKMLDRPIYHCIWRDITVHKESEAKLLAYQEQLRALTSELTLVEERERRRIASELHDQIGQNLALCKLKIAALEKNLADDAMKSELAAVRRLLECSIQDARSLIFDLSPPVLYELGIAAALEWLAERIQEQFHVPVEFESRSGDSELDNDRQVILFQVVRELLVNVGKHSRASQAKIILSHEESFLKIQVNDDGVGFDASRIFAPKGLNGGFGFFSMRERLNYLGGGLEVKSKPGQGSQIILTVPQKRSGAAR